MHTLHDGTILSTGSHKVFSHILAISKLKKWSLNSILNNSCQFLPAGWVQSLLNITI